MDKGVLLSDKGVEERTDESVLWWFGHVERMVKDRVAKSLCMRMSWYSLSG